MYKIKLSETFVIGICIALNLWISNVNAQGNCVASGTTITFVSFDIKPGEELTTPLEVEMENTLSIVSHSENPENSEKYFSFDYDTDLQKVLVSTTPQFMNYEKEQNKKQLIAYITLLCSNNDQIEMWITMNFLSVNNFQPEFSQSTYEIELPLPLPTGVDIFKLLNERISAKDYDLHNNQITFTSDITKPFSVETSSEEDELGKEFFATILTTEKILNIKTGIQFTIRATDSGADIPLYDEAIVKLMVQSSDEEPVEVPIFAKSLYIGTIDFLQTPPLNIDTITLLEETYIPRTDFQIELGGDTYFEYTEIEYGIELKLKDTVTVNDLSGQTQLSFVVRATRPDGLSGNTAILINIIPKTSLIFDNTLYKGIIKPDMTIEYDSIKLTASTYKSDVEFSIKEDVLGWFQVIPNTGVNEMKIQLIPTLTATDLLGMNLASLTILAKNDDDNVLEGESRVVFGIERADVSTLPVFEKQLYTGVLKRPISSASFELEDVLIRPNEATIEFLLSGDDTHLIKIESTLANGVTLGLQDGATIDDRTVLTVIVSAKITDTLIGSTVVLIHVDQEVVTIVQPEFEKKIYYGSLSDSIDLIIYDSPIRLTEESFLNSIDFTKTGDDAIYFTVQQIDNNNNVEIHFDTSTNLEDLADKNTLSFSIDATLNGDHIISGTTTIIIDLPKKIVSSEITPMFEYSLYTGTLNPDLTIDNLASIRITPETYTGDIQFDLVEFDFDLFKLEESTTNQGTIEIFADNITPEVLKTKQLFKFNVRATNDNDLVGLTAVVIEFASQVPQFEQSLYVAELSLDMDLIFPGTIKLTEDSYSSEVTFTLEPGFDSDLFSISSSVGNRVEIETNSLTEDKLISINALKIVISATNAATLVGTTVVVINVPIALQGGINIPEFKESIYRGSLTTDIDQFVMDPITVEITPETLTTGITYSLQYGIDSGFFTVTDQTGGQVTITLTTPLDASNIQGKTELSFIVEATSLDGSRGTTTVIVNFPPSVDNFSPIFEKVLYVGSLTTGLDLILDDTIALTGESYSDDVTFNIVTEFDSDLFSISSSVGNRVEIETNSLTEDKLISKNALKIVISATNAATLVGTTVVVINVPIALQGGINIPEFKESIYRGSLTTDTDQFVMDPITVEITPETLTTGITYSLQYGIDSGFFTVTDQTGGQVTITLTTPLDASNIQGKTELSFIVEATSLDGSRGTTTVIVNFPPSVDNFSPIFEKVLYVGSLTTGLDLILDDTIALTGESYSDDVTFNIVTEFDSDLFSISSSVGNRVEIETNSLTEDKLISKNALKIVISATNAATLVGTTVVVINVPITLQGGINIPEFKESIYRGSLTTDIDQFVMDPITVEITPETLTTGITYSLQYGIDSGFFTVTDQTGGQVTITLTTPLDASNIQGKTELSFIVEATSLDGSRGTTTVIVNFPPSVDNFLPIFEKVLYVGSLTTGLDLILGDTIALTGESYSDDVTFNIVTEFDSDLFSISSSVGNRVEIETNSLTEDKLISKNALKIVISATNAATLVGTTVVVINVPITLQGGINIPEFKESIYRGSLTTDTDQFVMDPITVEITPETLTTGITYSLQYGIDSGFFTVTDQTGGQVTITLTTPLDASNIQGKTELSFIVEATSLDGSRGTTTVIVNFPPSVDNFSPIFEKVLYVGSLTTGLDLILDDTIALTGESYSDDVTFNIVTEFDSDLFSISSSVGNRVEIETNSLTEDKLISKNALKIVISATNAATLVGTTVVVINVPITLQGGINIPEFKESIYRGSLTTDTDQFVMDPITVEITPETLTTGITYSLQYGIDSGFFTVTDQTGGQVTITLTTPLDASNIQGKTELSFIVEATSLDGSRGTTTVIVNFPPSVDNFSPIFEKVLYVGSLTTDLDLILDDTIALTGESYSDDVTFNIVTEFDSDLFSISSSVGNRVEIETNSLTEDKLISKNALKIVISATNAATLVGTTVVVINVPITLQGGINIPEFKESIYRGSLTTDTDQFVMDPITVEITPETLTTGITYSLQYGIDSGFFTVTDQTGGQVTITLTTPLDASNIQGKTELSFIVEATSLDGSRGTTTVIVNFPPSVDNFSPIFEKVLYVGSLTTGLDLILDDTIALTGESYSDDVTFNIVTEFDSDLFSISSSVGNRVEIETNSLTEDKLISKNALKIVISATNAATLVGTTVVVINVPITLQGGINIPEFKESIYRGSLTTDTDQFVMDPITVEITPETLTTGITYSLQYGIDSGFFTVTDQTGGQVTITLTAPLDASNIQGKTELSFIVEATSLDGSRGTTTVIVNFPPSIDNFSPVFEKSLYVGSLTTGLDLILEDTITLTDDSYSADVNFNLVDEYDHNLFEIVEPIIGNSIKITTKELTEELIKTRAALKVVIRATNTKTSLSGNTVVVVEIKSTSLSKINPRFEQYLYKGVLSIDFEIQIEPIIIAIETYPEDGDITILLDGVDKNLFTFVRNANEINIISVRQLTEDDLEDKQVLSLIVMATLPTGQESSTVVLFDLPLEGCRFPNDETRPKFEEEYYMITIDPDERGEILTVYAEVPDDGTILVIYKTEIEDPRLSSKIEMDHANGILTVTEIIPPGVYNFIVTATNPNDNSIGSANIKLTVTSIIYCSDGPTVSNALVVKHLEEEQSYSEIFNTKVTGMTNCYFDIFTVSPSSLSNIFEIEGEHLKSESFDRESQIFEDMAIPQITLVMELVCDDAVFVNGKYESISYNRTREISSTKDILDDNFYVYTSDIVRDDKKTVLSIIIKDINDNDPVFETPVGDIVIGYPESQLAEKLLPPFLIKVYATDKDEGINAKIRYLIDSNPHFSINPETGVVFPLKNSMDNVLQYNLLVRAIDEDGTGQATAINIEVKRLEEKHFIVISIENEILDHLDAIIINIESEIGLTLKVLNAVVVSTAPVENGIESKVKRSVTPDINGEQTVLRIIGYAFNADNEPIENDILKTELSKLTEEVYTISTQNLVDLIGDCDDVEGSTCPPSDNSSCESTDSSNGDECDDTGFIVGLIVLALLLLIAFIVIFVMWWKWIRPYRYVKRESSNERLEKDFNDTGYTEPVVAPIATTSDASIFGRSNFEIKNENAPTQVTSALPHSSPASLAKSLQSVLDTDNRKDSLVLDKDNLSGSSETDDNSTPPPRERKKSIKFNETVERIDILDNVTEKEDTAL